MTQVEKPLNSTRNRISKGDLGLFGTKRNVSRLFFFPRVRLPLKR